MVPKGGRHATNDVQIFGQSALWAAPLIGRARGDRAPQVAGPFHTRDWALPRAGLPRQSPVNCGAMRPPAAAGWSTGDDCPVAGRSARRPKLTKLALATTLRTYVEERLAGVVVAPSGTPVPGPAVTWKAAGMGRARIDDGAKPGALSRLPDACRSTSRMTRRCASATKPCSFRVVGRYARRPACEQRVTYGCPEHAYAGEARALSRRRS